MILQGTEPVFDTAVTNGIFGRNADKKLSILVKGCRDITLHEYYGNDGGTVRRVCQFEVNASKRLPSDCLCFSCCKPNQMQHMES